MSTTSKLTPDYRSKHKRHLVAQRKWLHENLTPTDRKKFIEMEKKWVNHFGELVPLKNPVLSLAYFNYANHCLVWDVRLEERDKFTSIRGVLRLIYKIHRIDTGEISNYTGQHKKIGVGLTKREKKALGYEVKQ